MIRVAGRIPDSGFWHRFCLALIYWTQGNTASWATWDTSDIIPEELGKRCEGLWIRPLNTSRLPHPQCSCTEVAVNCINLQLQQTYNDLRRPSDGMLPITNNKLDDSDFFLQIEDHRFEYLESITIHGNSLMELPTHLFGPAVRHDRLKNLNLSANYFMNVNAKAFKNLPKLESLDLSSNEIQLESKDLKLLKPIRTLRRLYLKDTFSYGQNKTELLELLMEMFREANLTELRVLDLSQNHFTFIPADIFCLLPKLEQFIYSGNMVDNWQNINSKCIRNLKQLDLTQLGNEHLGADFINFANSLPADVQIQLGYVRLRCTCHLADFINWLNFTQLVVDKPHVICAEAAPSKYRMKKVTTVPINELSCVINLATTSFPQKITLVQLFVSQAFFWIAAIFLLNLT